MTIGGGKGSADLLRQRTRNLPLLERQLLLRRARRPAALTNTRQPSASRSRAASPGEKPRAG
jgi:hypothetical protein